MTFLNPSFLFAAAAFVVPLVIHLLYQRRRRHVHWAANQFLDDAIAETPAKPRWENILLLLLRVCLPVALAIAMAGPMLDRLAGGGDGPRVCVLIDNSLPMQVHQNRAIREAKRIAIDLASQYPQSKFDLLSSSGTANMRDLSAQEFAEAAQSLRVTDLPTVGWETLLRERRVYSDEMPTSIFVISTFPRKSWSATSTQQQSIAQMVAKPNLTLSIIPVETDPTDSANVQVSFGHQPLSSAIPGERCILPCRVWNHGTRDVSVTVELLLDGEPHQKKEIAVAGHSVGQIAFGCQVAPAATPGQLVASLRIASDTSGNPWSDSLPADDIDHAIIAIHARPRVVIVSPEYRSSVPGPASSNDAVRPSVGSEAFHWAIAFDPYSQESQTDPRSVYSVSFANSLPSALSIAEAFRGNRRLHIVAPSASLNAEEPHRLESFLATGGILWGLPTPTDAASAPDPGRPIKKFMPCEASSLAKPSSPLMLSRNGWLEMGSQAEQTLSDSLRDVALKKARMLVGKTERKWSSLLECKQQPVVVSENIGGGCILQFGIGLSEEWSNLAIRPAALPLVHEFAEHAESQTRQRRNFAVGELVVDQTGGAVDYQPVSDWLPLDSLGTRAGLYRQVVKANSNVDQLLALRVAPGAGSVEVLDQEELDELASGFGLDQVRVAGDGRVQLARYPLWVFALMGVAGVLLSEGLLAKRLSGHLPSAKRSL